MDAGLSAARQARVQPRHELRALTYVCLDQANGGIVRDISHEGIGVQVVAAVRPQQQLRVRFELCRPRLRVETRGEVSWATRSGQCGIRFLGLSPAIARQINEWIFGKLLEEASLYSERQGSIFAGTALAGTALAGTALAGTKSAPTPWTFPDPDTAKDDDGLMVSAAPIDVIELPTRPDPLEPPDARNFGSSSQSTISSHLDWLSQPLSGRGLIWTINTLVVVAALLLFALVFLSVTGEPPRWPLATASAAAIFVSALYWGFFRLFGGASPGARLARLAGLDLEESEEATDARFR